MDWREYQRIIGDMYTEAEGIGVRQRSITVPDGVTGRPREVDAWLEIETKGHTLVVLIDVKFRKDRIEVKDVEGVLALTDAVGAHPSVLEAANGWTSPAERKAAASRIDPRLVTVEDALVSGLRREIIIRTGESAVSGCGRERRVSDKGMGVRFAGADRFTEI